MDKPTCKFCDKQALGYTTPPMCEQHLDLAVLAGYLTELGEPVTVETVTALLARCEAVKPGALKITAEDVPNLLAGEFAADYQAA